MEILLAGAPLRALRQDGVSGLQHGQPVEPDDHLRAEPQRQPPGQRHPRLPRPPGEPGLGHGEGEPHLPHPSPRGGRHGDLELLL